AVAARLGNHGSAEREFTPRIQPQLREYAHVLAFARAGGGAAAGDLRFWTIEPRQQHLSIQGTMGRSGSPGDMAILRSQREHRGNAPGPSTLPPADSHLAAFAR